MRKKILLLMVLILGLFPVLEEGELKIESLQKAYAQIDGGELPDVIIGGGGGDEEVDPCETNFFSCECGFTPACDDDEYNDDEEEEDPCDLDPSYCDPDYEEEEEEPEDPCDTALQESVKDQFTDPFLSGRIGQVTGSLAAPNTSLESGFAIYESSGSNIPGPYITGSSSSPQVAIGFTTSDPNYTPVAYVHTHPSGVYASPSGGDIYQFATANGGTSTINTAYIIAADGTKYAMVIEDPAVTAAFLNSYPASSNQNNDSFASNSPIDELYKDAYNSFIAAGSNDKEAVERANAVVMAEAGITLLKAPNGSTDFKEIQGTKHVDAQGNCTFTKSDCP